MDKNQRKRLKWIKLYEEVKNFGLVCMKCGISRPTLRKWLNRYGQFGLDGLKEESRCPLSSPAKKVTTEHESLILEMRNKRKVGAKRIKSELRWLHGISLSVSTIHKVLKKHDVKPLSRKRDFRKQIKRYSRKVPGERVQVDVCKIAPSLYQYTTIDDCTRYIVIGLYSRRTAANSIKFMDELIEEMPFSIQRIQTDRGREFFAHKFQSLLMEWGIKFRPIKPRSPYLNGKVERAQKTALDEFYAIVDLNDPKLFLRLKEWQHYYNWERPHSSLNGKTPIEKSIECSSVTPLWEEVGAMYDPEKERIQEQNYYLYLKLKQLK